MSVSDNILITNDDLTVMKRVGGENARAFVEQEKLKLLFPQFEFYQRSRNELVCKGYLKTNTGRRYTVNVSNLGNFPYSAPHVYVDGIEPNPHQYSHRRICYTKPETWEQKCTISFVISKVAIYLNKHVLFLKTGVWAGSDAHRL